MSNKNHALRSGRLVLAGALTLALAGVVALVLNFADASAAFAATSHRAADLTVTRVESAGFSAMMPGDRVTVSYEVSADVAVTYAFNASVSGADSLASELRADITAATGETLYSGPLASAAFGARQLVAGQPDLIQINVYLPLEATVGGLAGSLNLAAEFTAAQA